MQQLSPDQLDTLVAPIALYPDGLLSQVLAASTYPLEVAEAAQWLQQNRNLQGQQLVDAARQQNWDPSIQALVVFPDVVNRLSSDIRWTTDLGNAFLAQQADVMNAVQRMRAQARAAGKLNSNAQETVTTETQGDRTAIDIQPANPQVVYVPEYNPEYIWGPPAYGYYPPWYYPDYGFGFGPGIYIGGFFGGLGWGGWGWGPNWFNCTIFQNYSFFNHYGFGGFYGRGGFGRPWDLGPRSGAPAGGGILQSRAGRPLRHAGANAALRGASAGGMNRGQSAQSQPGGRSLAAQGNRAAARQLAALRRVWSGDQPGSARRSLGPAEHECGQSSGSRGGQWSHFGGSGSQPGYRSSPTLRRQWVPLRSFLRRQFGRKPRMLQLSLQPVIRQWISLRSFL